MKRHVIFGYTFSISKSIKFRFIPRLELIDPNFQATVFSWLGFKGWFRKSSSIDKRLIAQAKLRN